MINYYEILGLNTGAGIPEIKAAFRQLAKLYHPDVNPEGKEQFTKILKAYEVLSDPGSKTSYDYKLDYHQSHSASESSQNQTRGKNWRFDEKEMKRRQYYNEHIKKHAKKYPKAAAEKEPAAGYNEFKYVLFATPLAAVLFLVIMSLASPRRRELPVPPPKPALPKSLIKTSDMKLGDSPYLDYFGAPAYDTLDRKRLLVKNLSDVDMIVCLFKGKKFIRSFYITGDYSAEVTLLPEGPLSIRYSSGRYFKEKDWVAVNGVRGAFRENKKYFRSVLPVRLGALNVLSLSAGVNEGFESISEKQFFKK